ncbi:MAG TPA: hypothetical protein VGI35_02090, partial [Steroidobacteraceae bacterium]
GEPFVMPGGPLVPIASCLLNAGLIAETASARQLIGLAVLCSAAVLLYWMRELRRARTSAP